MIWSGKSMLFKKFWYAWTMSVCSVVRFQGKIYAGDHDDLPQAAIFHDDNVIRGSL